MKKLTTLHEKEIYPNKDIREDAVYHDRVTAKVIMCNPEGKIALVGNEINQFLLLPGGGVDDGEDIRDGAIRECKEETGYAIQIREEVGMIEDFRSRDGRHCISYCFIADIVGAKGDSAFTDNEADIGMYTTWVSVAEARDIFHRQQLILEEGRVRFYNTGFNIARDRLFLIEAIDSGKIVIPY